MIVYSLKKIYWAKIVKENLKFIYSEKATKFCEIFTLLLSYLCSASQKVKISQNFVVFSEYMNFKLQIIRADVRII